MNIVWHDVKQMEIEGKGWGKTSRPFDRFPLTAKNKITAHLWDLSRSPTGMMVRFETNATEIHAHWSMRDEKLHSCEFPSCAYSGLDLYSKHNVQWMWCGSGNFIEKRTMKQCLLKDIPKKKREFILYLRLRNPLKKMFIGVPEGSSFKPLQSRKEKPITIYGSSIVHGAYATRSGMIYPAILGRRLNTPIVNLGFAGSAIMEPEVAELISQIESQVYVLDPLPNMNVELIQNNALNFLRILCTKRPDTPIVLVEDGCPYSKSWINPKIAKNLSRKYKCIHDIIVKVQKQFRNEIYYIKHEKLFGNNWHELSTDSIHPNDIGHLQLADAIVPVIRKLIS